MEWTPVDLTQPPMFESTIRRGRIGHQSVVELICLWPDRRIMKWFPLLDTAVLYLIASTRAGLRVGVGTLPSGHRRNCFVV